MWKTQKKIPNTGTYNWIYRPTKSAVIIGLNEGKFKGNTIEQIVEFNSSYLDWALKNVQNFKLTDEVLVAIRNK